jgi:L-seryl-tRNA(Ser) seleniumtransferase
LAYLDKTAEQTIPFWQMATVNETALTSRATQIIEMAHVGRVVPCSSLPGAGSVPGASIPSVAIALDGDQAARLRACNPPIIARVKDDQTILDLRTVDPADDAVVINALLELFGSP